jgi:ribosomal protein S27E
MSDLSSKSETDQERAKLNARAAAVADRVQQSVGIIAGMDEEVLVGVFDLKPAQVRGAHVYALFGVSNPASDLTAPIDRCFTRLLRTAATFRKLSANGGAAEPRTVLLIDDLHRLHREVDFLQKFLMAPDPLSQLARTAYANKYMRSEAAEAVAESATPATENVARSPASKAGGAAIQKPSPAARQPAPAPRSVPAQPSQAVSSQGVMVTCDHCRQQFTAAGHLIGKQVKCTRCGQPFRVSSGASASEATAGTMVAGDIAAETEASSEKIPVSCPHCRRHFLAIPGLAGKTVGCPACGQSLQVPQAAPELDPFYANDLGFDTNELEMELRSPLAAIERPSSYPALSAPPRALGASTQWSRPQDDQIPRWIWYAMGGALGVCVLVALAIFLPSLVSDWLSRNPSSVAEPSTTEVSAPAHPSSTPGIARGRADGPTGSVSGEAAAGPAFERWDRYTSPKAGYSVLMPSSVAERVESLPGRRETVAEAVPADGDGRYQVRWWDQPDGQDPETVLDQAVRAITARWQATDVDEWVLHFDGQEGREVRFVSTDSAIGEAWFRVFATTHTGYDRVYVVARTGPPGSVDEARIRRYFASFRLPESGF